MQKIKVRGIVFHEGKLLCVKLKPYNEMVRVDSDWWCLPGGSVENGENIENALTREMYEETGVPPVLGKLVYVHQFIFKQNEYLEFFFEITNSIDYLNVDLEKTSHGSTEIEKIDFINPKTTSILPTFLAEQQLVEQSAQNASVKFFSSEGYK
jgi:8-oxo-dGTP pyrophosphatase MutT (NUDIX family)